MSPLRPRAPWSSRSWALARPHGTHCVLGAPAGAQAFDTGPHSDLTRDALTAEGFGADRHRRRRRQQLVRRPLLELVEDPAVRARRHDRVGPRRVLRERRELAAGRARRRQPHRTSTRRSGTSSNVAQGRGRSGTACSARRRRCCAASSRPAGRTRRCRCCRRSGWACTRSRTSTRTPTGSSSGRSPASTAPTGRRSHVRAHADVVRRPEGRPRPAQRLHRRVDRPQGPPARRLEHRRQPVDDEGRQQGLARAARGTRTPTSPRTSRRASGCRRIRAALGDEALWRRVQRYANRRGGELDHDLRGALNIGMMTGPLAGPGRAVRPVVLAQRSAARATASAATSSAPAAPSTRTSRTAAARASAAPSRRCSRCSASRPRTATSCRSPRARRLQALDAVRASCASRR